MPGQKHTSLAQDDFGLDAFGDVSGDQGVSLERLSESFARLLGQGEEPYDAADAPDVDATADKAAGDAPTGKRLAESPYDIESSNDDQTCPVTPRSILEAILFVGHPDNEPLTSQQIAALMRGVRANEIDALVRELNQAYEVEGCPYLIESRAAGYRLTLRPEYAPLREGLYRKTRQARLSQAAIDVLAIVAYHQPVVRDDVNKLRGRPTGSILAQLVRRQLLRIERRDDARRTAEYFTTDRFLRLFGLESLDDLPRGQELGPDG
jgi:segregation and condensation protein B